MLTIIIIIAISPCLNDKKNKKTPAEFGDNYPTTRWCLWCPELGWLPQKRLPGYNPNVNISVI